MIIKIKKDRRDNDKIKLIHDKRSPFGPYKMDKVERQCREITGNYWRLNDDYKEGLIIILYKYTYKGVWGFADLLNLR